MDQMEVEDNSPPKSQISKKIAQVESLWSVIHSPVIGMFSDLTRPGTEQGLRLFFESMIRSSETLNNILIPPSKKGEKYDTLERQYTAFTRWLFGILFHILGTPLSKEIRQSSVDVQAHMLRILYSLHFTGFHSIYATYIGILDKIFDYFENTDEKKTIQINEFTVEKNIIESLDLISYPVVINNNTVHIITSSILEIFLKSDVMSSNQNILWWKILKVLEISEPDAKLAAMKVASKMITSNVIHDKQFAMYLNYNTEIMKTIDNWQKMCLLDPKIMEKFSETMANTLENVICTAEITDIAFVIIELIADKKIVSQNLEKIACDTIINYLIQHPRCYSDEEMIIFRKYFVNCPEFSRVLVHFIAFDIKPFLQNNIVLVATKLSRLWKSLIDIVMESINSTNFPVFFKRILQIYRLLSSSLSLEKVRTKFFDDFDELLRNLFIQLEKTVDLNSSKNNNTSSFMCFVDMLTLNENECNKNDIQHILLLPWSQARETISICDEGTYSKLMITAKSLDTDSKIKCLESVCQLGKGKIRIKYLSTCVTNAQIEFSNAVILNSIYLLNDPEIKFSDINTHILKPALITQRKTLGIALSQILGSIVCLLSGTATINKLNSNGKMWHVNCRICDDVDTNNIPEHTLSKEIESLFTPYFQLFKSKDLEIRKNMINNLSRFSNHICAFNTNNILTYWLPLIRDSSHEIRIYLVNSIETIAKNKFDLSLPSGENNDEKNMIQDELPEDLTSYIEIIMKEFIETLNEALTNSNDSIHKTLLMTVKEFARIPLYFIERRICIILIISTLHSNSTPTAIALATDVYQDIAEYNRITPKELFIRYRKDFIEIMMKMAARNYYEKNLNLASTLHKTTSCIGYVCTREFFRKNCNLAITYLVPLAIRVPEVQGLFPDVAHYTNTDVKGMFVDYFQYICPHVLINETPEVATECLQLISTITKLPLNKLFTGSFLEIFRELLLHFHENMERVINCLEILSQFDESKERRTKVHFNSPEKLANYLNPQLHAVLVNFDSNLSTTTSDEYTQRCALASFATLIKFMGADHLNPLKYKILATLRTSLGFTRPGFRKLSCYAWDSFIRNVSVEELGPLLSTICLSLNTLLECCPEQTNSMLEYLLIDNNTSISNYISELFFIEDLNVSSKILITVVPQIKRSIAQNNFEDNLKLWQKRIELETDEVRLKALIHLQKFLEQHRSELNKMILNDTNHVHSAIVQLLDALLTGCQHADEKIRLYSGECLGELGGIEPSLLPRRIVSRSNSKFIAEMNGEFACALLIELVRAFQMLDSAHNFDCFSLAIQEILKTYDIAPEGTNKDLWDTLPPMIQQIVLPFLTSHYKALPVLDLIQYPIYGTESGATFENWIYNWASCMITSINNETLSTLLNACRPALKRDIKTTIFCIPYIVIHCIINGNNDDREGLLNEIHGVIRVNDEKLDNELIKRRPLRNILHDKLQRTNDTYEMSDEVRQIRCSQMIFVTIDHIKRWLEEKRLDKNTKYMTVQNFFSRLDNVILAEGCYQSHEYHRALMYLERHMVSKNRGLTDPTETGLLTKIYTQLEEPDGVSGILALQEQSPTLQQLVLAHEISGQLQDAATCYERLAQRHGTPKYIQGMIQCYLGLEQPFTATNITKGILNVRPELKPLLLEHEPFWQLAHFVHLDTNDKNNVETTNTSLIDNLINKISPDIQAVKKKLVSLLGAASHQGYAYQQNYPYIMKLHAINEFEKAMKLIINDINALPALLNEWEQRGQLVRGSRRVELVLGMRRAALDLGVQMEKNKINNNHMIIDEHEQQQQSFCKKLQEEIGKIWLRSARIARKAGLHQQAYMYILSASDYCPTQELYIEQAQLYWQRDCQKDAFITLKRLFTTYFQPSNYYKDLPIDICTIERQQFAKAKLLFATYNEETVNVDPETNKLYYKEAVDAWRCWEKSYLACAQYHDTIFDRLSEDKRDIDSGLMIQLNIITNYAKSLLYGCKFIHQSMPRMLTIWMNFALRVQSNRQSSHSQLDMMSKFTKIIEVYVGRLPKFMWLTVFSQLVSRICHPAKEVQSVLNTILVNLIIEYPQYCLWMMASVLNSSYPVRQKRCQDILNLVRRKSNTNSNTMMALIKDFTRLWQRLIELSNKPIHDNSSTTTVSLLSKTMRSLLASPTFGPIMMPTSKLCQLCLPQSIKGTHTATLNQHNPFTTEWVSITGIAEQVTILASLQRPRRITLYGSDGREYLFMCKPKDDLRRDFRLMEFNDIVNKYLQKDPESRQRRLYIRTYGVIPLNEECGLIEWIPNLIGFRVSILNLYKERGIATSNRALLDILPKVNDSLEKKREIYLKKLLPKHPPILCNWFTLNFPDSYGWYEARTAYIRTTAVMSMVGYILGLGDRHGDNILFDSQCGDCVHVDFNCLFNRGESFTVPERVPFRLTHNMVDAMGPLKFEGPFRKSCEITMRILRQEASTLISVLTPFVYDPLVSWTKNQVANDAAEKTNEKAVQNIKDIELRLKGFVRSVGSQNTSIPVSLSVEGQTNHLILDATNIDNLCQMYQGWTPYI